MSFVGESVKIRKSNISLPLVLNVCVTDDSIHRLCRACIIYVNFDNVTDSRNGHIVI